MELFIFARFHARSGAEAEVEEALHEVVDATRKEAGCLSIHAFRSIRDPQLFYIHSRWTSEAAFEEHVDMPHTVRFVQHMETLVDHPVEAQRCKILV